MQDVKNNPKPTIRKVYDGKTFSINLPRDIARKIDLQGNDHMSIYFDDRNNQVILKKLEVVV